MGIDYQALPRTDGPRTNRDPREVERKTALLREPDIAPLTAYVERLRAARPEALVPYFDPTEAGIEATILGLFEAPGPKATPPVGSGFVSADNNDQTAQNVWMLLREAEIDRHTEYVAWNVVPWYLGDGRRIRAARAADISQGAGRDGRVAVPPAEPPRCRSLWEGGGPRVGADRASS